MAEVGVVVAAEVVETVVEGGVAAALVVKQPTMPIKARWRMIKGSVPLPRSLHTASLVKGKAYIFGGEVRPQELADNDMHVLTLPTEDGAEADYKKLEDKPSAAPTARAGHAAAVVADRIYVFGGRGSSDDQLLEENGRVWVFDTVLGKWSHIDPMPDTAYPQARSRHAIAVTKHPLPSPAAQEAGAAAVAPHGSLFIQGGRTESGMASDTWCFDIAAATWSQLPHGPDPPREDASMTFAGNRLWRFGGFDGRNELGKQVDFLRIAKSTFDDKGGKAEVAVFAETDRWESIVAAEGELVPGPRSGAGLHPVTTGQGRNFLLCILGEKEPAYPNEKRSGAFWTDIWSHQIQPTGMTGASFKDAARQLVGAKTAERTWAPVDIPEFSKTQATVDSPSPRVRFATAFDESFDKMSIFLWGGVSPTNEVLGDGWVLAVEP